MSEQDEVNRELAEAQEAEGEEVSEGEEQTEHDDAPRPVASTMVSEIGYNRDNELLEVVFVNGKEEDYACTPDEWESIKEAPSIGKWMHEHVL